MRRGHHGLEQKAYRKALQKQADHDYVLGFLAVSLARTGSWEESKGYLKKLHQRLPNDPFVAWMSAKLSMLQGNASMALVELENAVQNRHGLSTELQSELYRDIALDPVFAPLRRDWPLHRMLLRHFGADAPKISR